MMPKPTASNFVVRVACVSVSLTLQPDCIKSLNNQSIKYEVPKQSNFEEEFEDNMAPEGNSGQRVETTRDC